MAENIFRSLLENTQEPRENSSQIGEFGERVAADYLRRRGYRMVATNFKVPIGRNRKGVQVTGEIDLIALDCEKLCFIEVKTRSSNDAFSPLSAVDLRKQRQIIRTSRVYLKTFGLKTESRFDVVSIVLNGKRAPTVELHKGFWNAEKFKKRSWSGDFAGRFG